MARYFEPMEIGDIFSSTFSITRRTLGGAGLTALLMLIVGSIISGYGGIVYITGTIEVMGNYIGVDLQHDAVKAQEMGMALLPLLGTYMGAMLVFALLAIAAQTLATAAGWEALTDQQSGLTRRAFGRPLIVNILQTIMIFAVLMVVYLLLVVIAWPMGEAGIVLLSVLLPLVVLVVMIYTFVRVQNVVVEERGPWQGMIASIARVKGNFWRIFLMVVAVVLVWFTGLLLINFLLNGNPMGSFGAMMNGGAEQSTADIEQRVAALTMMKPYLEWPYIIISGIWSSLWLVVLFNLTTVIYADLLARRGEFETEEEGEWELPV